MSSTIQPYFNPKTVSYTRPISAGFSPTIKNVVGTGGILHTPGQVLANCQAAGKPDTAPANGVSYGDPLRGAFRLLTGNK